MVRNARTAIAYSADYVYFIVVDGKHPGVSLGMTLPALAQWAKSNLGATDAVSEDSGGSATMAVNGQIVNDTYCNFTDCRSAQQQIPDEPGHSYTPEEIDACTPGNCEPAVANGMMMVEVQAPVTSTLFLPGATYTPGGAINLRLGPGTNYPSIATINAGTPGDVQDSALNGIYAKGHTGGTWSSAGRWGGLRSILAWYRPFTATCRLFVNSGYPAGLSAGLPAKKE